MHDDDHHRDASAALESLTDTLMRAADRLPLPTAATTH